MNNVVEVETRSNCVTCPLKCDMFKKLSDEELNEINCIRLDATFKPGELIIKQGAPTNHIVFLVRGLVKVFMEGYEGKNVILSIVKPTQFVSGPELFYNNTAIYSVSALKESKCCYVSDKLFKKLISENSQFASEFISEFSRRSINTLHQMVSLTQKKMNGRVAEGILYLSKVFESDRFDMVLTKQEFADLTAMARESAIRILHQFHNEELIELNGSEIHILERKKLMQVSELG